MEKLCRRVREQYATGDEREVLVLQAPNGHYMTTVKGPLSDLDIGFINREVFHLMIQSGG